MAWLRWDVDAPHSDVVGHLAEELRLPVPHAFGCYVACCLGFGAHRQDGQADQVSDTTLEQWALWAGKRGRFAAAFRRRCVDEAGRVRGWWRQDALLRHQQGKRRVPDRPPEDQPKHEDKMKSGITGGVIRDFTVDQDGNLAPIPTTVAANDIGETAGANAAQMRRNSGGEIVPMTMTKRNGISSTTSADKTGTPALPWLSPEGQAALADLVRAHPAPDALLAEVVAIHAGARPGVPTDPAAIGQALVDLRLAGTHRITGNQLRAFVRRAGAPQPQTVVVYPKGKNGYQGQPNQAPAYPRYGGPKRAKQAPEPLEPVSLAEILTAAKQAASAAASQPERGVE